MLVAQQIQLRRSHELELLCKYNSFLVWTRVSKVYYLPRLPCRASRFLILERSSALKILLFSQLSVIVIHDLWCY